MSAIAKEQAGISNLLAIDQEYPSSKCVADGCLPQDWAGECKRWLADPEQFWEDYALKFLGTKPWSRVFQGDGVHHQCFVGAKTNITMNALDRHAHSDRCLHLAGRRWQRAHCDLRPTPPPGLPLRQRPEIAQRSQRRPRRDLHAAHN
jgi:Acetyl-coenzyme A synthetase N-terminus